MQIRFLSIVVLFLTSTLCAQGEPTIAVETVAEPVYAARLWTTALAPQDDGSFDLIAQYFNYRSKRPDLKPQWIVVNLKTGKQQSFTLPGYANTNYTISNQLRAPNGRIFFSAFGNRIHYYEPADRTIKSLGPLIGPKQETGYAFFYRLSIGPDGNLYATTQSHNRRTALARIDTETLKWNVWTDLGSDERAESLTYGYYHAADPPWVYIAVGQGDWRLAAINTETAEHRVLSDSMKWIAFGTRAEGIRVELTPAPDPSFDLGGKSSKYVGNILHMPQGASKQFWWGHNGKLYPANQGADPSTIPGAHFSARWPEHKAAKVKLPEVTLGQPTSDGSVAVQWRMPDTDQAGAVTIKIDRVEPIALESLTALNDGRLLGNAVQYNGFYIYDPQTKAVTNFGRHGPSRPTTAIIDDQVYITGYPNSVLYRYDPQQPWKTGVNPIQLGHFRSKTRTHYPYWLKPAANGRLYLGGRCERGITGSGIGWYDLGDGSFHGHNTNLSFLTPRGMLLFESINTIVLSGELQNDPAATTPKPAEAQLVVYDMDLKELKRLTVKPGLTSTGWLYHAATSTELIGCINKGDLQALYRYDLSAQKLLVWQDQAVPIRQIVRHEATGVYWVLRQDNQLCQLDPQTLEVVAVGRLSQPVAGLLWVGDQLYGRHGSQLLHINLADLK